MFSNLSSWSSFRVSYSDVLKHLTSRAHKRNIICQSSEDRSSSPLLSFTWTHFKHHKNVWRKSERAEINNQFTVYYFFSYVIDPPFQVLAKTMCTLTSSPFYTINARQLEKNNLPTLFTFGWTFKMVNASILDVLLFPCVCVCLCMGEWVHQSSLHSLIRFRFINNRTGWGCCLHASGTQMSPAHSTQWKCTFCFNCLQVTPLHPENQET